MPLLRDLSQALHGDVAAAVGLLIPVERCMSVRVQAHDAVRNVLIKDGFERRSHGVELRFALARQPVALFCQPALDRVGFSNDRDRKAHVDYLQWSRVIRLASPTTRAPNR